MDEKDKQSLEKCCSDLTFDDDITEFCCVQCKNIAIYHFTSDCNHVFCRDCQEQYIDDVYYKCPKCQATISTMTPNDPTFERNLLNLIVYCPNMNNGCGAMSTLKKLSGHLRQCKHVDKTQSSYEAERKQMSEQMKTMVSAFTSLSSTVQEMQKGQSKISRTRKKKESLPRETRREQQKNDHSSQSETSASAEIGLNGAASGLNCNVEDTKYDKPGKKNAKKSTENTVVVHRRLKAQHENQQTSTQSLVENSESSLKESNDHSQHDELTKSLVQKHQKEVEEMQSQINALKEQLENQQPAMAKQSPGPSNINKKPPQMTSGSSLGISDEEQLNLNDHSIEGIPNKEYNILLLGQTGVGKSTFINAFANYLTYTSLEEAYNAELISLIPCQFSISDDSFTQRIIQFGQDTNENMGNGDQSSTQSCRAYRFSVKDFVVRMIDSPGIGDIRGIEQDRQNIEDIFTFITQYDELHAVCILLKPNESKLTTTFQFCVTQLLCQLHENASKNIVFVFTNSRNTFYRPGDTIAPLKTILGRIKGTSPYVEIPFHKKNTFCLDSEAFRFLVAANNHINFSDGDSENFRISWKKSVEECYRMIRYVVEGPDGRGLAPHNIEDTTSSNAARRVIIDLSKPLAENAKLLQDNIQVLDLKLKEIDECKGDVNKLKDVLYVPTLTLQVKELDQPRTVCASNKCRQKYKVGKLDKYRYPVICHDRCYLRVYHVEVIGIEQIRYCSVMNKQTATCEHCGCHYSQHLHIIYESEVVEKQEMDQNIQSQLDTKEGAIKAMKSTVKSLEEKVKEYENSHMLLTKITAKLAVFLRQNALVSRNDAVEEYLKQEIENEKALNSTGANNVDLIQRLNILLQQYNNEKKLFEKAEHGQSSKERITTDEVMELITELSGMNICGETITKMVQAQSKIKKKETDQRVVSVGPAWNRRFIKAFAIPVMNVVSSYFNK